MSWFLVDAFDRLERFIRECPHYEGDAVSHIMVVASYLPLFTWAFVFVIAAYDRTSFHVLLTSGLFVCDWVAWLLRNVWAGVTGPGLDDTNMCASAFLRSRPCHEAAIVWFVFVYYIGYDLFFLHRLRFYKVCCFSVPKMAFKLVLLFVYGVLACWSQTYLRLFNINEVLIGAGIGFMVAICVCQVYHLVLPGRPGLRKKMTFLCCLEEEESRSSKRGEYRLPSQKSSARIFP